MIAWLAVTVLYGLFTKFTMRGAWRALMPARASIFAFLAMNLTITFFDLGPTFIADSMGLNLLH